MAVAQEILVKANGHGEPVSLTRSRQSYRVLKLYEHWRVVDEWWASEVRRDYFRVETHEGLVYDVYHDMVADKWYLTKVQD